MKLSTAPGRIGKTLALLLRAERMMAARRVSALGRQSAFVVAAVLCASVAVVLLNAAAYLWLATFWTPALSALAVGGANLLLAGLSLAVAAAIGRRLEHSDLAQTRDLAQAQLEQEIDSLVEELRGTARDVRGLARDPLGTILPGVLTPLINALIERALAAMSTAPGPSHPASEANAPSGPAVSPEPFPEDPAAPEA